MKNNNTAKKTEVKKSTGKAVSKPDVPKDIKPPRGVEFTGLEMVNKFYWCVVSTAIFDAPDCVERPLAVERLKLATVSGSHGEWFNMLKGEDVVSYDKEGQLTSIFPDTPEGEKEAKRSAKLLAPEHALANANQRSLFLFYRERALAPKTEQEVDKALSEMGLRRIREFVELIGGDVKQLSQLGGKGRQAKYVAAAKKIWMERSAEHGKSWRLTARQYREEMKQLEEKFGKENLYEDGGYQLLDGEFLTDPEKEGVK